MAGHRISRICIAFQMPPVVNPALKFLNNRGLPVGQKQPDFSHITLFYQLHFLQRAFSLPALGRQDVTVVRLRKGVFPGPCFLEPLGGSPVGFNFRHGFSP